MAVDDLFPVAPKWWWRCTPWLRDSWVRIGRTAVDGRAEAEWGVRRRSGWLAGDGVNGHAETVSGTNTRVLKEEELITINIDSSEQSRAQLRVARHRGRGLHLARPLRMAPPRPTPRPWDSPRPTPEGGSASLDTEAMGFALPDP